MELVGLVLVWLGITREEIPFLIIGLFGAVLVVIILTWGVRVTSAHLKGWEVCYCCGQGIDPQKWHKTGLCNICSNE